MLNNLFPGFGWAEAVIFHTKCIASQSRKIYVHNRGQKRNLFIIIHIAKFSVHIILILKNEAGGIEGSGNELKFSTDGQYFPFN